MLHEQVFHTPLMIPASLLFRKNSLLPRDDSLISQKNSLFTNVGNLPLSL
jgi:hypothetical protein